MKKWLKKKFGITTLEEKTKRLEIQMQFHEKFVEDKMAELREFTRVDADIGFRGNNTIILTGVYKNRAYVHFYDLGEKDFAYMVEILSNMRQYALIRTIDAPPNYRGFFDI